MTDKQTEGWVKVIRGMKSRVQRVSQKEKNRRVAAHYSTRKQPNGGADLPPTGARQPRSGTERANHGWLRRLVRHSD